MRLTTTESSSVRRRRSVPAGKKSTWCRGGGTNIEADEAKVVRCPVCNRRLRLKTILHQPEYGEKYGIDGYEIPQHKEKI